jgi:hypothetical protein
MAKRAFVLTARVSTDSPRAIQPVLETLLLKGSVRLEGGEFFVNATLRGDSARELNRALLTALRRAERRTRLRADWAAGGTTERFFDYVPKGTRPA